MPSGWYVIAGGACVGKTSVIKELERRGYRVVHEAARELIDEGRAAGKSVEEVRGDVLSFQRSVIKRQREKEAGLPRDEVIFFDRANPDARAFLAFNNIVEPPDVTEAIEHVPFRRVFMLDPVTFRSEYYRTEDEEEIARLHEAHVRAYGSLGLDIVTVPVMPVPERVDFILGKLD